MAVNFFAEDFAKFWAHGARLPQTESFCIFFTASEFLKLEIGIRKIPSHLTQYLLRYPCKYLLHQQSELHWTIHEKRFHVYASGFFKGSREFLPCLRMQKCCKHEVCELSRKAILKNCTSTLMSWLMHSSHRPEKMAFQDRTKNSLICEKQLKENCHSIRFYMKANMKAFSECLMHREIRLHVKNFHFPSRRAHKKATFVL